LSALVAVALTTASTQAQDRPTLRLVAGLGDGIVSINDFIGDPYLGRTSVRVAVGTRVIWSLGSDEYHTVTFLAGQPAPPVFMLQPEDPSRPPMLNPLLLFPTLPVGPWDGTSFIHVELQQRGQEAEVVFARPGKYEYVCLFHPAMMGTVEVVAAGAPGLTTQAAVDALAAVHDGHEHSWQVAEMLANRSEATRIDGPRGTSVAMVRAGTDWRWGHVDLQAFLPENVTIQQGDTVVWYVDHTQPHTVTFHPTDGTHPDFMVIQLPDGRGIPPPRPNAPPPPELLTSFDNPDYIPRLVLGPGAMRTKDPVHDGQSLYSSGLIGEHPLVAVEMEKAWGLTFNTPGTFAYHCGLHEPMGMRGTVTVLPR
jgi:plastocyanin